MKTVVVRPANAYGPYDDFEWETSHVVPALIRRVVERHNPLEVWGDGNDIKDLIFIDDLVEGILLAMEKLDTFEQINIRTGRPISIKEALNTMLKVDNYNDAKVAFDASKPTMIPKRLIDVSKAKLDVHVLNEKRDIQIENSVAGVKECIDVCLKVKPELIVMESTGGYEYLTAAKLSAEGLPVAVVNPRRIRDFARAIGMTAKTDKIDAKVIALYAANCQPIPQGRIDDNSRKLKALTARRQQLLDMRIAENNRIEHSIDKEICRSIEIVIKTINREI